MENFALATQELKYEEKKLHTPPLHELQSVLQNALENNFHFAKVEISNCEDLSASRFGLMAAGLNGAPTLLEVGGPPYLFPMVQRSKLYNIKEIVQKVMGSEKKVLAIGAGAGPFPLHNSNCEGIYNLCLEPDGLLSNGSFTAKVNGPEEKCALQRIPQHEHRCALLLNMFLCNGSPGKVIKINVKKRIGHLNFVESILHGLREKYEDKVVGMGGIFLLKNGNAHQHVMRDFSKVPLDTETQVKDWLKFYDMPGQLNALGTLVTNEYDLDLRLIHFHSFSNSNWGGHYHYDTTPESVEYEAYFNVAERIVRVDRPLVTHKLGRD